MTSFFRSSYLGRLSVGILFAAFPLNGYAQVPAMEIQQTTEIINAIHGANDETTAKRELLTKRTEDAIGEMVNEVSKTMIDIKGAEKLNDSMPGPLENSIISTAVGGTEGRFTTAAVNDHLKRIMEDGASGRGEVENIGSKSNKNPYAAPALTADAYLWKRYRTFFCIPESANAVEECKEQAGNTGDALNKTLVNVFLSEGTWQSNVVLDSLVFARRFFGGGLDREDYGKGASDPINFTASQARQAKGNLRMAILSDLAARRAPTHPSTGPIMEILLKVLDKTGGVSSIQYNQICNSTTKTAVEAYACSFTGPSNDASGNRVMSQAAVDRIMQFDYMLSSNLYSNIYDTSYPLNGPIQRLEVFMKAQQVTQDYRHLRLLQMKVAMKAMNMMNNNK